jgi:hypothetical protein
MKTRIPALLLSLAVVFATAGSARALDDNSPEAMIADAIVVRPVCLAATAVGAAFYFVALPFSLFSRSSEKAARVLVVKPAEATFTRPLGEMSTL